MLLAASVLLGAGAAGVGLRRLEQHVGRAAGAAAAGRPLRDRPDREDVAQGRVDARRRPDDDAVGARRHLHDRRRDRTSGKAQIRKFFERRGRSSPRTTGSRTRRPTRSGSRSNGDKGTLYFECHYIDVETGKLATSSGRSGRAEDRRQVADHDLVGSAADAQSLTPATVSEGGRPPPVGGPAAPARAPVARIPISVRTKLLVAFALIAALLVVVGVLGLRVLGQSNARVEELGTLQRRAATYQSLQTQAQQLRQLLARARRLPTPSSSATPAARCRPTSRAAAAGCSSTSRSRRRCRCSARPRTIAVRVHAAARRQAAAPPDPRDPRGVRGDARPHARARPCGRVQRGEPAAARRARSRPTTSSERSRISSRRRRGRRPTPDRAERRLLHRLARSLRRRRGGQRRCSRSLLGFVLSQSVVDPIRRSEARLAEIARGDFTGHVDVPNRDELGALAANLNRMNDELRRLYGELETASRHKSEFLANMSHELRTPLNAIIGFSELLQQQMFGELNERQRGVPRGHPRRRATTCSSLINDILDLSKVEAGRMELELRRRLAAGDARARADDARERAARERDRARARAGRRRRSACAADERKIKQVVFNLLSNAVKFTPRAAGSTCGACAVGREVEVAVADTGPGSRRRTRS